MKKKTEMHTIVVRGIDGQPIEMMSPDEFRWDRWESDYGYRLNLDYGESIDNKRMRAVIASRCIGWCDGSRLSFRPKSDMVALMLEDDEFEKFWFHYPKESFSEAVAEQKSQKVVKRN